MDRFGLTPAGIQRRDVAGNKTIAECFVCENYLLTQRTDPCIYLLTATYRTNAEGEAMGVGGHLVSISSRCPAYRIHRTLFTLSRKTFC